MGVRFYLPEDDKVEVETEKKEAIVIGNRTKIEENKKAQIQVNRCNLNAIKIDVMKPMRNVIKIEKSGQEEKGLVIVAKKNEKYDFKVMTKVIEVFKKPRHQRNRKFGRYRGEGFHCREM
jgi:hypothetical protein